MTLMQVIKLKWIDCKSYIKLIKYYFSMDYIYLINNDLSIIKNKTKAIEISLLYPEEKIEILVKKIIGSGYIPTCCYYKNGIYYNY